MNALSLAADNAALLRRLNDHRPIDSIDALARELERDPSNTRRTIRSMLDYGLLEKPDGAAIPSLTEAGHNALRAIATAEGKGEPRTPRVAGIVALRHDQIVPAGDNARTAFAVDQLQALAESLRQDGLQSPILVGPADEAGRHRLIDGERRWRAWGLNIEGGYWAGDRTEPVRVLTTADDRARVEAGIVANEQRVDLNRIERAQAYERLARDFNRTNLDIAGICGKTPEFVQQHRRLLKLDPADQAALLDGSLTLHDALAKVAKPKPQSPAFAPDAPGYGSEDDVVDATGQVFKLLRRNRDGSWSATTVERTGVHGVLIADSRIIGFARDHPDLIAAREKRIAEAVHHGGGGRAAPEPRVQAAPSEQEATGATEREPEDGSAPDLDVPSFLRRLAGPDEEEARTPPDVRPTAEDLEAARLDAAAFNTLDAAMTDHMDAVRQAGARHWSDFGSAELADQVLLRIGEGQLVSAACLLAFLLQAEGPQGAPYELKAAARRAGIFPQPDAPQ